VTSDDARRAGVSRRAVGRAVAYVLGGGVAIYFSTWSGNVAFYWSFQRAVLAQGEDPGARDMLWRVPDLGETFRASSWPLHEEKELRFRVPPGEVGDVEEEGGAFRVPVGEGEFMVRGFPRGFIGALLRKELRTLGRREAEVGSDVEVFTAVVAATPEEYSFGWSAQERQDYAARLLVKMLLFEPITVRSTRWVRRDDPPAAAYLVEYTDGSRRVLSVDPEGSLVVLLGPDAPGEWGKDPGNWLR
jgi:hypothetical protein